MARITTNNPEDIRAMLDLQWIVKSPSCFYLRPSQYAAWLKRYREPHYRNIPIKVVV